MNQQPLQFSKTNFILLQNEKEALQKTIKLISEENIKLKSQVHDMKITVRENKKVLNDYIINITNKDKLFEKLNLIIAELKEKIKKLEEKLKEKEMNRIQSSEIKELIKDKEINFININQNNNYSLTSQNNYINTEKKENENFSQKTSNEEICNSLSTITSRKDIKYNVLNKNSDNFDNIENIREKQNIINEELNNIKIQLQNILEQNTLKSKINQNLKKYDSNEKKPSSLNNSYISQDISDLSNSFDENIKKNNSNTIINLKEKYNTNNLSNFFMKIDEKCDSVYLIDGNLNIWEIKKSDMTYDELNDIKKKEENNE